GEDEIVWSDGPRGVYRKLVVDGNVLTGAMLVGDTTLAGQLSSLLRSGQPCPATLLSAAPAERTALEGTELLCACNGVTRETVDRCIRRGRARSIADVARATGASTGCGSCAPEIEALLAAATTRVHRVETPV